MLMVSGQGLVAKVNNQQQQRIKHAADSRTDIGIMGKQGGKLARELKSVVEQQRDKVFHYLHGCHSTHNRYIAAKKELTAIGISSEVSVVGKEVDSHRYDTCSKYKE